MTAGRDVAVESLLYGTLYGTLYDKSALMKNQPRTERLKQIALLWAFISQSCLLGVVRGGPEGISADEMPVAVFAVASMIALCTVWIDERFIAEKVRRGEEVKRGRVLFVKLLYWITLTSLVLAFGYWTVS